MDKRRQRLGRTIFFPLLALLSCGASASDDLKPYPAAESGYRRVVIRLPQIVQPDEHKVELLLGKRMAVDCNRHTLAGEISSQIASGWGYSYLVLEKVGPLLATRMACPPDTPPREEFVAIRSQRNDLTWLRYNPKLPIVVYVPEGIEVRYRVWSASGEFLTAGSE